MAEIKLNQIAKSFHQTRCLEDINLEIQKGELVVFVGPSGCGKSTLLRMIAGLETISGGTLEVDGMIMNDVPPAQRGVAMVFQTYALYPHMTVRENMAFALKIAKKTKDEVKEAVQNAARILQLEPLLDRLPKALSGGQRQRVAIGRAIVRNPRLFLFDEPLSNLDAALRVATRIEIAQLKEQMPETTMIYVTHDQVEAMTLANRIVVLNGGGIEQVGSPLTLYSKPANEFVARFIGSPAMNMFPGKIEETGSETVVRLRDGGKIKSSIASKESDKGLEVNIGIRPEDLLQGDESSYAYEGKVIFTEALGEVTLLYFFKDKRDEQVIAKLPGNYSNLKGKTIKVNAEADKVHIFHKGKSIYYS